jgi:hypothetical protein
MIEFQTEVLTRAISAEQVSTFMVNCTDDEYQRWWPETHLLFHTEVRHQGQIGSVVYFDEYIGKTRMRCTAVVQQYEHGKFIAWQLKKLVMLPVRVTLALQDTSEGVKIVHTLVLGFRGLGSIIDPLIRFFLPNDLEGSLDDHVKTEFRKLATILPHNMT